MGLKARHSILVILAGMLAVGLPGTSHSQLRINVAPAAPGKPPGPSADSHVDTNKKILQALNKAKEALATPESVGAIEFLQERIIDRPDDFFLDQELHGTLKSEARRLLKGLTTDQRRHYELRYKEPARQILAEAKEEQDLDRFGEVARRYFLTESGAEAAYLLGSAHLDQGRALQAAMQFDEIVPDLRTRWEPAVSLKQAIGWRQAGLPDKALELLVDAKKKYPNARFGLGDRTTGWFDRDATALSWLDQAVRAPTLRSPRGVIEEAWMLPRGAAARNGSAMEVSPLWRPLWTTPTLSREEAAEDDRTKRLKTEIEGSRLRQQAASAPAVPAAIPVAAVDVVPPAMPKALADSYSSLDVVVFRTLSNLRAVHLATGRTLWESILTDPAYERLVESDNPPIAQNNGMTPPLQSFLSQRAWKDLTAGTLSTDGVRVYSVEDVGFVSSYPQYMMTARGIANPLAPNDYNRLVAVELDTGRLQWEVGGPRLGKGQELTLAGTFFLGPPLAVDGRLYVLGENSGEVMLHVLDSVTGGLEWSQTLAIPEGSIDLVPRRRMVGISPATSNGVLVCPTDSGLVVGVDPAARRLLWGMKYSVNTHITRATGRGFIQQNVAGTSGATDEEPRWLDSTPLVGDGHVIVTPRDSEEMHCIRLYDGKVVWRRPRGVSLTVASIDDGNVVVVGRNQVEALSLTEVEPTTGGVPQPKSAWRDPTPIPVPSGRGVRCGSRYHIPLSTAEIATLDLKTGQLIARSKTQNGAVPGNLIAVRGTLVSQSIDSITALDGLESVESQIEKSLEGDATAEAMALRGELRLHRGQEADALADLRKSVESDPKSPGRPILAAALLERFRHDFAAYRTLGPEIEKLLDDPQQRADYLRLTGAGLLRVGERKAAFAEYLKLAGNGQAAFTLEKMSDDLSVRSDRWVRARLAEIVAASTAAERSSYDEMVRTTTEDVLTKDDPAVLRGFLGVFGDLPLADAVRRRLSETLDPEKDALALELLLMRMREASDPEIAGYATHRLAELYLDRERGPLIPPLVLALARRFADVKCFEGKTGAELAEEWKSDDLVLQFFGGASHWPERKLEAKQRPARGGNVQFETPMEIVGPRGAYDGWRFCIDGRQSVVARDGNGQSRWSRPLDSFQDPKRQAASMAMRQGRNNNDASTRMCGHLLAVRLGTTIAVMDGLSPGAAPRDLWMQDLNDGNGVRIENFMMGNQMRQRVSDGMGRPIGSLGVVTGDCVFYQSGARIVAADPLTGDVFWERRNMPRGSEIFGDREMVFVVAPNSQQAAAYHAIDGEPAGTRTIPPAPNRLLMEGRRVVAWEKEGDTGSVFAVDPGTGERVWNKEFNGDARMVAVEAAEVAILEPRGHFTILDVRDGTARVDADVGLVEALESIAVVRSAERYVLVTFAPPPGFVRRNQFNINSWARMQSAHGPVWAFDRASGRPLWATRVENQSFDVNQPEDLPVMTFSSYSYEQPRPGVTMAGQFMTVKLLDVRNGQTILESKFPSSQVAHRFNVDLAEKTIAIDFIGTAQSFEVKVGDAPVPPPNLPSTTKKSAIPLDETPQ